MDLVINVPWTRLTEFELINYSLVRITETVFDVDVFKYTLKKIAVFASADKILENIYLPLVKGRSGIKGRSVCVP